MDGCWALSNKRVCRVLARQLFETNARVRPRPHPYFRPALLTVLTGRVFVRIWQWHLHEFLVAWNALVPDEFQPEFEWLRVRRPSA